MPISIRQPLSLQGRSMKCQATNKALIALFSILLASCGAENSSDSTMDAPKVIPQASLISIPTVVHVLYREEVPESNISDEKIQSQFIVLNQDFRALNPDLVNVPDVFKEFIADTAIEFKLANLDPDGKPTTGITRTRDLATSAEGLHFNNGGGKDAWPSDQYLNIWVIDNSNRNGDVSVSGYAQAPGGNPQTDGIVISYHAFGTLPPLNDTLKLGRTTTHELGHWLNLKHIFGASDTCEASDLVDDTPTSFNRYIGNPVHPSSSCGSLDMFMNFMDYSNDESLIMFTKGQKQRMRAVFEEGGGRSDLFKNITHL